MNNLKVIDSYMQAIWFRPDGTYNLSYWNGWNKQIAVLSDEDLEDLQNKVNTITSPIVDGDVIMFSESSFPKLFLKEIGSKVTRTIKESKATRIVTNAANLIKSDDLRDIQPCLIVTNGENYYMLDEGNIKDYKINLDNFMTSNNFTIVADTKIVPNTLTPKKLEVLKYYEKLATTEQLVEYINKFLPNPTDEQKETLLALLRSTDENNVELGVNMLRMFNISDCIFDIYQALAGEEQWGAAKTMANINRTNVRWKYLMSLGNMRLSDFKNFNRTWSNIRDKLYILYSLPFITLEQKRKCWLHAYIVGDYSRFSSKDHYYNMPEQQRMYLSDTSLTQFGFPTRYADIS